MSSLTVSSHPLLAWAVTRLRDRATSASDFRRYLHEAGHLLACEATRLLPTRKVRVQTPLATATGFDLRRPVVLVPVLRSGLALLDPFREILPDALIGFVGQRRNEETLQPESYLFKVPEASRADVFVLDPMLATGGSASATLANLKAHGARHLHLVCLVAAPEGVARIQKDHPEIPILLGALDRRLNQSGFILPGLGDAGDRFFGT
jgi:uracil phosphoribosyltransferase